MVGGVLLQFSQIVVWIKQIDSYNYSSYLNILLLFVLLAHVENHLGPFWFTIFNICFKMGKKKKKGFENIFPNIFCIGFKCERKKKLIGKFISIEIFFSILLFHEKRKKKKKS